MYARNTILTRKKPFAEDDPRHAYNQVRVIGPSPVVTSGGSPGTWSGVSGQGVVVEPVTGFAGNVDRPLGELQADYDITSEPEVIVTTPTIRVIDAHSRSAGPSPEEVFAEAKSLPKARK